MAAKNAAPLDPAALKAQHAIIYEANTSPIRDDTIALIQVLVSDPAHVQRKTSAAPGTRHSKRVLRGLARKPVACLSCLHPCAQKTGTGPLTRVRHGAHIQMNWPLPVCSAQL